MMITQEETDRDEIEAETAIEIEEIEETEIVVENQEEKNENMVRFFFNLGKKTT
jgi:GH24 family phage-related lysozyme (muramidase)